MWTKFVRAMRASFSLPTHVWREEIRFEVKIETALGLIGIGIEVWQRLWITLGSGEGGRTEGHHRFGGNYPAGDCGR